MHSFSKHMHLSELPVKILMKKIYTVSDRDVDQ